MDTAKTAPVDLIEQEEERRLYARQLGRAYRNYLRFNGRESGKDELIFSEYAAIFFNIPFQHTKTWMQMHGIVDTKTSTPEEFEVGRDSENPVMGS